ncbi:putative ribonuclease H-like domain-containing protein [Tanacetum coccineum]
MQEVAIDAIPLAVKSPSIIDWKIHKEGIKSYYQITRADGKSQMYMIFSHMLKSFDREDLVDLYKRVKAKYESTRPVEDLDLVLCNDLKTMFEPHVEDVVWRNQQDYKVLSWKLYDYCGVHSLRMQHMHIYMLVEKKYPLAPLTLSQMLEKKLMIDYESEMAYQLCKFIIKQLKKIKSLLDAVRITAAHVYVNTALMNASKACESLELLGEKISQEDVNQKLLRCLSREWNTHAGLWRNKANLDTMSMDDLYHNLKVYEQKLKELSSSSSRRTEHGFCVLFKNNTSRTNGASLYYSDIILAHGVLLLASKCKALRNQDNKNKESLTKSVHVETSTSTALLSCDGLGGYDWSDQAKKGPNYALMAFSSDSETSLKSVEEKLEVYKANESIYSQDIKGLKFEIHIGEITIRELRKKLETVQKEKDDIQLNVDKFEHASKSLNKLIKCQIVDNCKKGLGYENYNAVPSPYTGNFMPSTLDLSFTSLEEFVNEPVVENSKPMSSKEEPKVVTKNDDASIIKEWVSNDEEEDVSQPKIEKKTVRPSIVKKEFFKSKYQEKTTRKTVKQDKGVIDSRCSRHMTGNMSYLTDYEEIDGGYVAFRENPKEEKSQELVPLILILSPNLSLIDKCHVLLRVPRKNNMYSVDLKNIVPKGGLTCLFAKATSDESKLWHRSLGHLNFKTMNKLVKGNLVRGLPSKLFENDQTCVACQKGESNTEPLDETSGILKSFITGIENLVDHKVKVIRCDNGTEFKNREMNQFCEMKGILRQFSVARTPQQNGVAERRNRTLIEAARTMLADSKLPTTFWAEAVNTACYVQIEYHLGKFDGKADEGFFVGYSLNSKAFRVFNSRTRIVEENLHIRFSESTPNVVGNEYQRKGQKRSQNDKTEHENGKSDCGNVKAKKSVKLIMEKLFRMELELMLFWSTVKAKTINGEEQLHALVDGKKIIITESFVRRDLQLADEEDEAVHKELGNSLVRAATTASSLEAEQDSGNITKTRSKAIPNKSSSLGTTSGGGLKGNTLQSDKDRLKLKELMALCSTLQNRVLDLEKIKTSQHNEIDILKRRVKKLEKKNRSRTHKLKRLYKGRIDAIDANEEITLVSVHDMNVSAGEEVAKEVVEVINTAKLIIDATQVSATGDKVCITSAATTVSAATTTTSTITTIDDITLAQALEDMKSTKPKQKGDKGKGILIEPVKKKDQILLDEETALNLQAEFDEEERLAREKDKKEQEANIALIKTWDDIQAKIDANHQLAERLQAQEQKELSVEEKATLFQQLLEKRRKHFAAKRA